MKKDFLEIIKIINGIYLISFLIWMLYLFFSYETIDNRTLVIMVLFLFLSSVIILLCTAIFYFFTKSILVSKKQIKYGLILLISILDLLYLMSMKESDHVALIFILSINSLSLFYIYKNNA